MQNKTPLDSVIKDISERKLSAGLLGLENFLLSYPQVSGLDVLANIKVDYDLMAQYWKSGINDPELECVYDQLIRRLYSLAMNVRGQYLYRTDSYWMATYDRPRKNRTEWGVNSIRAELENYVSEMVMLELAPANIRAEKSLKLNQDHQSLMSHLFEYVLTSQQWKTSICEQFVDILLAPTIDVVDQQLLVSAITLAVLNAFDENKVLTLIKVYQQSVDVHVRQRALVGWAITIDEKKCALYPELQQIIAEVCSDETTCQELTELQMQLFFCKNTENDQKMIRDEIMPELMKGNHFKMGKKGVEEIDEDALEDILHPDAAELDMERMEQSLSRMTDMQKEGSDIYFAGFSQMKRFSFFYDLSNWFVPFYEHHPAISKVWENKKGRSFLHSLIGTDSFCDSDKYSFLLSFEQVVNQLPPNILKMMEAGEAVPMPMGGLVAEEEKGSPAYIRRMYLQDFYRFYRLFSQRSEFENPFENISHYLFFANELTKKTPLSKRMNEVVNFLIKRKFYLEAERVLLCYPEEQRDYQYCILRGHLCQMLIERDAEEEIKWYQGALNFRPGDKKALTGLARAYFYQEAYDKALDIYKQLLEITPEVRSYMLNASICMTNLRHCEDALKLLYKLNYLNETDMDVVLVLAWVLTIDGRFDEAKKYFAQLMGQKTPQTDSFLYYGYCLWFSFDIEGSVKSFKRYCELVDSKGKEFMLEKSFYVTENDVILKHHRGDGEVQLMLDAVKG